MSSTDRSWLRSGVAADVHAALASGMAASELWSLLLDVLQARASRRTPAQLGEQWQRDRFVQPCYVDQRTLTELDRHLLAAAAVFEAMELSPLAPLGVSSAVALASQNKIVSTIRGTEVVSDPTNVLALECARRLQADPAAHVRLATSHRCVRAQAVPPVRGFAAHFRMFCLASAGQERGSHGFIVDALGEHIRTQLAALARLEQHGYAFADRKLKLLASARFAEHARRIAAQVGDVPVEHALLEHDYYSGGFRFMVSARAPSGEEVPFIDGGAFDWLGRLTSNRKLSFVASGMGSQIVAYLYRR